MLHSMCNSAWYSQWLHVFHQMVHGALTMQIIHGSCNHALWNLTLCIKTVVCKKVRHSREGHTVGPYNHISWTLSVELSMHTCIDASSAH